MSANPARAASSWAKAKAHCAEALAQDADTSPMSVIHSSYYTMFHAARAVLFLETGSAPKTHDRTIQQFGLRAAMDFLAVWEARFALPEGSPTVT